jgi:hypothetical protein
MRKEYAVLIHRKPSKGCMALRRRKRVKDAAGAILLAKWKAEVKVRAGLRCEYCGKRGKGLQAHHVFSCANKAVRTYPPNGIALCAGHHIFFAHKRHHEFIVWAQGYRGIKWWTDLNVKAQTRHTRFTAADEPGKARA